MNYSQKSNQGCLAVSLLYLTGIEPTVQKEKHILCEGLFRLRENFTFGCLLAFLDHYTDTSVTVYVDNTYYLKTIDKMVHHPRIQTVHRKNDSALLNTIHTPFIAYIDNNITDGWTHLPHFVLVTHATGMFYTIFDPWTGSKQRISKTKLLQGIDSLRSHIKVCPFIITESVAH
jgi:Peptidase C39 family